MIEHYYVVYYRIRYEKFTFIINNNTRTYACYYFIKEWEFNQRVAL